MGRNSKNTMGDVVQNQTSFGWHLPVTQFSSQKYPEYFPPFLLPETMPNGAFNSVVLRVLAADGKTYPTMPSPVSSRFPLSRDSQPTALQLGGCERFTIIKKL